MHNLERKNQHLQNEIQMLEGRVIDYTNLWQVSAKIYALDIADALVTVAMIAKELLKGDMAIIFPYDIRKNEFKFSDIARNGVPEDINFKTIKPRDFGTRHEVKKNKILKVSDATDFKKYPFISQNPESFLNRTGIKSFIGIHLATGEEDVGVLYVDYYDKRNLSKHKKHNLQILANWAAIAIKNAIVHDKAQNNIKKLRILNDIGHKITAEISLNNEELLMLLYRSISELMDVSNLFISFFNSKENTVIFELAYINGVRQEKEGEFATRINGNGLTEYVIREKKPLTLDTDIEKWLIDHKINKVGKLAKSWIGIPVIFGDQVFGMIGLQDFMNEYAYSVDDEFILTTIATQFANTIQNSKLFRKVEDGLFQLDALVETSQNLSQVEQLELLFKPIVDGAVEIIPLADKGSFFTYDSDEKKLVCKAAKGFSTEIQNRMKFSQNEGCAWEAYEKNILINIPNAHISHIIKDIDHKEIKEIKSILCVPILTNHNEVFAVLNIDNVSTYSAFTKFDEYLLSTYAIQVGVRIKNLNLINQLKSQKENLLEKMSEMSPMVTKTSFYLIAEALNHDIRNLMISLNRSIAKFQPVINLLSKKDKNIFKTSVKNTINIIKLIDTLVDLFDFKNVDDENISIKEIIKELVSFFKIQTVNTISFELDIQDGMDDLFCNKAEFSMIIYNILSNAVNAIHSKSNQTGIIKISVFLVKSNYKLIIEDNGPGIKRDNLQKIFFPGFTTKEDGLGIGLFFVHETINSAFEGSIFCESRVGSFTRFIINIPEYINWRQQ